MTAISLPVDTSHAASKGVAPPPVCAQVFVTASPVELATAPMACMVPPSQEA